VRSDKSQGTKSPFKD